MANKYRVITNSERECFACRRRWHIDYVQGKTSKRSPVALETGDLGHQMLEAYYRSGRTMTVAQIKEGVVDPWLDREADAIKEYMITDGGRLADKEEVADLCVDIMGRYISRYHGEDWEVRSVEVQLSRTIRNPDNGEPMVDATGRTWLLAGKADLIKKDSSIWVVDHKLLDTPNLPDRVPDLSFQRQGIGYVWMMQDPHETADISEPTYAAGIEYNLIRRRRPSTPKIVDKGKKLSTAACDTTADLYEAEMGRLGNFTKEHMARLNAIKQRKWFHRQKNPISDKDVENFGIEIWHVANEMMQEEQKTFHVQQTSLCTQPGSRCDFKNPCSGLTDDRLRTRDIRHEELVGDLAEPNFLKRKMK